MSREGIIEMMSDDEEALFADGFDEAIIGLTRDIATSSPRVCYDIALILEALILEGMTEEDAIEHFEYNISGAYVGPSTPIFIECVL